MEIVEYKVLPRENCKRQPNKGTIAEDILGRLNLMMFCAPIKSVCPKKITKNVIDAIDFLILHRLVIKTTREHAELIIPQKYSVNLAGYPANHNVLISAALWTRFDNLEKRDGVIKVDEIIEYMERKYTFNVAFMTKTPVYPECWDSSKLFTND